MIGLSLNLYPKYSAGPTEDATLVIAAGQSNAQGWATDVASITSVTNGNAYQYFTPAAATQGAFLPLGRTLFGRSHAGPAAAFAETWAAGGGGAVLWCDCASGGSSMVSAAKQSLTGDATNSISGGTWDLSDAANIYLSWCKPKVLSAKVAAAAAGFNIVQVVVLWVQGEQDAGANALSNGPDYRTKLNALIAQMVTDLGVTCFMISKTTANVTPASFNSYFLAIRQAQEDVVSDNPSLCTTAYETETFYDDGYYVDTLHYTAAGYNAIGSTLATRGLAKLGISYGAPSSAKWQSIMGGLPAFTGWKRIRLTHECTSTFVNDIYSSGVGTPTTVYWIDLSGVNQHVGGTSMSFTFSGGTERQVLVYVLESWSTGSTWIGGSASKIKKVEILDSGVKLARWSQPNLVANYSITDADVSNITWTASAIIDFASDAPAPHAMTLTNAALANLPSQAYVTHRGVGTFAFDLTQPGGSNVKSWLQPTSGLSVAQVNAYLQAIDANGFSGGSINLNQYSLALGTAAAPPSGAGATAKTNLISRGYSVTTD